MSEDSAPKPEIVAKNKEEPERKFGCPCGKWYLSYPALFTHVKQKHEGKPPGTLIKPKTDKARGRPRASPANVEEDAPASYDIIDELEKALAGRTIEYIGEYEMSTGDETCQDMGSDFLRVLGGSGDERKILNCFMNYLRFFVQKRFDETFWETQKPNDIIDVSNDLVKQLQDHKQTFPLDEKLLIDLLDVLFAWMNRNKWTEHKLLRRPPEQRS